MKKNWLLVIVGVDLLAMAGAGLILHRHLKRKSLSVSQSRKTESAGLAVPGQISANAGGVASSSSLPKGLAGIPALPGSTAEQGIRRIRFTYSNSKAKSVTLRADFTGWKAEPMQRDARGVWTFQANLTPGPYAYIYMADGKAIRDPANKQTKRIGTNLVSAILVKPAVSPAVKP